MNQDKIAYGNNYLIIIIPYFAITLLYQEIQIIEVINTPMFRTQKLVNNLIFQRKFNIERKKLCFLNFIFSVLKSIL